MAITYLLGIKHGFGFSAGAIDYVVNYGLATKPLLLFVLGIVAFIIYYFLFRLFIKKFDIPTPGRGSTEAGNAAMDIMPEAQRKSSSKKSSKTTSQNETARIYIKYLGGPKNIEKVEGCITRLRLEVNDTEKIKVDKLKK